MSEKRRVTRPNSRLSVDLEKAREWERSGKPLERTTRLDRGKAIRPVNPERRKRERERAYGPVERREWIKRQPSVASGKGPCVNAHVEPPSELPGMGRKADCEWIVPMTDEEHRELHQIGRYSFERKYGIKLAHQAGLIERAWQEHKERSDDR